MYFGRMSLRSGNLRIEGFKLNSKRQVRKTDKRNLLHCGDYLLFSVSKFLVKEGNNSM